MSMQNRAFRGSRPVVAALLALWASAGCGTAQERDAPTAHWDVVCVDFDDEGYRTEAQRIVEAIGEVVFEAMGGPIEREPEFTVYLYRDAAAYEAAERPRTGGQFAANRAFSSRGDLTSHLVCEPFWPADIRARLGLPGQMQRLIAHEAAHLAIYASSRGRGVFHPKWFAEGFSQWAERRALERLGIVTDLAGDPWYSESMARAMLRGDDRPRIERILDDELDDLAFHERYALQWLVIEAAANADANGFAAFVQEVGGLRSWPRLKGDLGTRLLAALDLEDAHGKGGRSGAFDRAFGRYLAGLEMHWAESIRSLAPLALDGERVWVQSSFGEKNAVAFRREAPEADGRLQLAFACELLGKVDGQDGPPQLNVLLDRQDEGFVSISLHGSGWVTVFEHAYEGNLWHARARGQTRLPVGVRHEVVVTIDEGRIAVAVAGDEVVSTTLDRAWDGPWGIGAQAGSVGIWHRLPIE